MTCRPPYPLVALLWFILSPQDVLGQQAIVSLPSADVTPRGEFFVMQESQVRTWSPKPYWNTTNFWCFGLGYHTELAITTLNIGIPHNPSASLANGFKTALPVLTEELPRADINRSYAPRAKCLGTLGFARKVRMASRT
ncbi:MAG: hypothetical protein NZX77_17255, partial [Polyangiaceae bacterium]|nr:hypothetical protein [Polyangiaceae bacterium]